MKITNYTWRQFEQDCDHIVKWIKSHSKLKFKNVYGIPRGGLPLAVKMSNSLEIPLIMDKGKISKETLIVDDISDTGETLKKLISTFNLTDNVIVTLFLYKQTKVYPHLWLREKKRNWIRFPWEK
jgi:hypoxanthine phosphoribosyltransferase